MSWYIQMLGHIAHVILNYQAWLSSPAFLMAILTFVIVLLSWYIYQWNELYRQRTSDFGKTSPDTIHKSLSTRDYPWLCGKKCLVTGGMHGFLGQHIVDELLALACHVIVLDASKPEDDDVLDRVEFAMGSITDSKHVNATFMSHNVDIVFHCTASVKGTQILLEACRAHDVPRLVYTSSASMMFSGYDQMNTDEGTTYPPNQFSDPTALMTYLTEELVLEHGTEFPESDLRVVALRPHGLFGPRDASVFPPLIDRARRGTFALTKFQIGHGRNMVDFTYVKNAVHGHFLAGDQLSKDTPLNGQVYFLTNDEPVRFWEFMTKVLLGFGYSPPYIALPYALCLSASYMVQFGTALRNFVVKGRHTPAPVTPSIVQYTTREHYYSCAKAKKDFNYQSLWTVDEGLACTMPHFDHLQATYDPTMTTKEKAQAQDRHTS